MITGDPGSGKTTLLERLAVERLEANDTVVLLRMGLWNPSKPLLEQLAGRWMRPEILAAVLTDGDCWVMLDALDEARGQNVEAAFEALLDLLRDYPNVRVVGTCRAAQLPSWAVKEFAAARILPLSTAQVDEVFLSATSRSPHNTELASIEDQLRELCRNPLMLSMAQELLLSGDREVLHIASPGQLYDLFIELINARERGKHPVVNTAERALSGGLSLRILGEIAWRMTEGAQSSIAENDVAELFEGFLLDPVAATWWGGAQAPSVPELIYEISSKAPLKELASVTGGAPHFSFLHLTFRDAFAGRHLASQWSSSPQGAPDLRELALDESRRYWNAIVSVAGTEASAGKTTARLLDLSFQSSRQEILLLATRCAIGRWDTPQRVVGDLAITILDAFKNWGRPFDYDLMRAGRTLISRIGAGFPARLKEDLMYFADKYAFVVPRESGIADIDDLFSLLDELESQQTVVDAMYTLSSRFKTKAERVRIAREIGRRLPEWPSTIGDFAVATLKDLGVVDCLPILRSIVVSTKFTDRARAFSSNGVAELGDVTDLETLMRLLKDKRFAYRDSVSWSIQKLAVRIKDTSPKIIDSVLANYMEALRAETNDAQGRYAKGNIYYSLGVLGARTYLREIERILRAETDGYVVEDGLLALSLIGDGSSAEMVRSYCTSGDPGVRLKAAEALVQLRAAKPEDFARILADDFRIVRRVAEPGNSQSNATDGGGLSAAGRLVRHVMERGAVQADEFRESFHISSEEREAFETFFRENQGSFSSLPSVVTQGFVTELRLAREDAGKIRLICGL